MRSEETIYAQVEAYLNNQLSTEERSAFEQQYREDSAFADTVNTCVGTLDIVEAYGQMLTRATFKEERRKRKQRRTRVIALRRYSAAAAVVLLLTLIPFRYFSSPSMGNLYDDYFEISAASPGRDGNYDPKHPFWQAIEHYNTQHFQQATQLLESLSQDATFNSRSEAAFYLGLSYMSLNSFEKALDSFDRVEGKSSFLQATQWYRGLCYLQLKDKKKAIESFQVIVAQESHYQRKKAQDLLDALD